MSTQKFFNQLLIFMNLCQHAKNQAVLFCSGDIPDLKILQSDWPRACQSSSPEPKFFQI